jgi:hypothetical protein
MSREFDDLLRASLTRAPWRSLAGGRQEDRTGPATDVRTPAAHPGSLLARGPGPAALERGAAASSVAARTGTDIPSRSVRLNLS